MEQLKSIREDRGLSRASLAAMAGINPATVNRIENGERSPTVDTLEKLARALDVEVADFFPKVQAPLPGLGRSSELKQFDRLGASFVEAWASYVRQRVEGWKEALPESARAISIFSGQRGRPPEGVPALVEELRADPKLAFGILRQSEVALSELTALVRAAATASLTTRNDDYSRPGEGEAQRVWRACLHHGTATLLAIDAGKKWRISEQVAREVVSNTAEEVSEELAQVMERSERAAEEHQKVVALFGERQSA